MLETKTRAVHVVEVAPAGQVNVEADVDDGLVAGAAVAGVPGFVSSLFGVDIRESLSHVTAVLSPIAAMVSSHSRFCQPAPTYFQVVCQFFMRGSCRFGNSCRNEHPQRQSGFGSASILFSIVL